MNWFENMLAAVAFGVSLAMLGAACPPPPDPGPEPTPDAGAPDADADLTLCQKACQRLGELKCPGGEDQTKCVSTCDDTEASGVARFCPAHVAAIKSCDEVETAFEACE